MNIGFIGQGFIGKNYADDFQNRGFMVLRYALEEPYRNNKERVKECDIVFVAVPTPTTPKGFDGSIVEGVLPLIGKGKIAVIKSTTLPGTVQKLQQKFSDIFVLHSPEFLREKTAVQDAQNPTRNIIGIPKDSLEFQEKAKAVLSVLPKASYELIAHSDETELIKYANNSFLFFKLLFGNLIYDLSNSLGANYDVVREAVAADPRIGPSHLAVIDKSAHAEKPGRGAGGHCFVKDFAALRQLYEESANDPKGLAILCALEEKNKELLLASKKDLDILKSVYGKVA